KSTAMEFSISNKSKKLVLGLISIGALLAIVGIFTMGEGEDKFQRIMANFLIDGFFFFAIALGALFFLALQYATETGWYAYVKRVIEGVAGYIPVGAIILLIVFVVLSLTHGGHIYIWMDPDTVANDHIIQNKSAYLNVPFFLIRTVIYL